MNNNLHHQPSDVMAHRFPISVKGVLILNDTVPLLRNERDEWELPGGKLEPGESPEACLMREIEEELGLPTKVGAILDSWMYKVCGLIDVFIVTYFTKPTLHHNLSVSHEHKELRLFKLNDIDNLNMPGGYKQSIRHAFDLEWRS